MVRQSFIGYQVISMFEWLSKKQKNKKQEKTEKKAKQDKRKKNKTGKQKHL